MAKGKKKLWSYNTGHKGINWVRVYERSQSPKSLYIEWYWEGRRWQRALRTVMGHPVTDHRIAMNLADNMAATLEQRHNDKAFVKFRAPQEVTSENEIASLGETVEKYHAAKEGVWSDHHRKSMERRRAFWLAHLGADTPLTHISPAMVEGAPMDGGDQAKDSHVYEGALHVGDTKGSNTAAELRSFGPRGSSGYEGWAVVHGA